MSDTLTFVFYLLAFLAFLAGVFNVRTRYENLTSVAFVALGLALALFPTLWNSFEAL